MPCKGIVTKTRVGRAFCGLPWVPVEPRSTLQGLRKGCRNPYRVALCDGGDTQGRAAKSAAQPWAVLRCPFGAGPISSSLQCFSFGAGSISLSPQCSSFGAGSNVRRPHVHAGKCRFGQEPLGSCRTLYGSVPSFTYDAVYSDTNHGDINRRLF